MTFREMVYAAKACAPADGYRIAAQHWFQEYEQSPADDSYTLMLIPMGGNRTAVIHLHGGTPEKCLSRFREKAAELFSDLQDVDDGQPTILEACTA